MTQQLTRDSDPETDTSHVPFAITDRSFITKERYIDKEFFALENEKLWPYVWQMACRLEELPKVGDFVEYVVGPYSILVVRVSSTEIKAYHNACRHRATQLGSGCGTFRGGQIVCPFHGWRWSLDGSPAIPLYGHEGFEGRAMDPDDLKLRECLVDTWANCVFINMDRNARPLLEALDPIPSMIDPLNVSRMYTYWWRGAPLQANWKMAQEAFMEGWHVQRTHPQLTLGIGENYPADRAAHFSHHNGHNHFVAAAGAKGQTSIGESAGMSEAEAALRSIKTLCEGGALVHPKDVHVLEGLRNAEYPPGQFPLKMMEALITWNKNAAIPFPAVSPEATGRWGGDFFMFPNFFILPQFGNALVYRIRPDSTDPEHCLFDMWFITLYPEDYVPPKPTRIDRPGDDPDWPLIPRQDFSNIEAQQRGLHTHGFRGQRLAHQFEDGIANMHAYLDTYLARP
jgi:phenylpropionate dioxygenase-like ring-hydroxylating dioxygenase large terminal subunit